VQRHMGAPEDGACADGEILLAGVAAVESTLAGRDALHALAGRADGPLGPQAGFQIQPRRLLVWELLEELEGADGYVVVHGNPSIRGSYYPPLERGSQVYNSPKKTRLGNTATRIKTCSYPHKQAIGAANRRLPKGTTFSPS